MEVIHSRLVGLESGGSLQYHGLAVAFIVSPLTFAFESFDWSMD